MIAEKQLELEKFHGISQKMLSLAEMNDWEKLPDLENERKKIMVSFFSQTKVIQALSAQDSAHVEKVIQDILIMNDKITQLAEKDKMSISLQRQNIKKRQNVHSAYLQNK